MKPQTSKLQQQPQEATVHSQERKQQAITRGFSSVEEMLRFDAMQNPVPESVKTRLTTSVQKEPRPGKPRSWWRKLIPE
ncbi:MAG TPA: hypothetical protein VI136_25115 [Verrucomicrobiae bacterium]